MSRDKETVALFRCDDCGDEFIGSRDGHHAGYRCFACGGQITRLRTLSEEEVAARE